MTERTKSIRQAKARPRYVTTGGELVPGVTTILSVKAKPALVGWAFNIGKHNPELPSIRAYVDDLAEIGTVVHLRVNADLMGTVPDFSDYAPSVVAQSDVSFEKYLSWKRGRAISLLGAELSLVSDEHRYGGTLDFFGVIDGALTVLDVKTGKAIYPEYFIQAAAYAQLVVEHFHVTPAELRILQIGRTGAEGFAERIVSDFGPYWRAFAACRALYDADKEIDALAEGPGPHRDNVIDIDALRGIITRATSSEQEKNKE